MTLFKKIADYFAGPEPVPVRDLGRNDTCWCGSGRKYKKCHLPDDEKQLRKRPSANCGTT